MEVFIVITGEVWQDESIDAIYQYEWLAKVHAENLVRDYNRRVMTHGDPIDQVQDFIMEQDPMVQPSSTDKTIAYWQSECDFIRIDKWEVI